MSDGLYLNLGCGEQIADGWVNVEQPRFVEGDLYERVDVATGFVLDSHKDADVKLPLPDGVMELDIARGPWPWENRSVDGIVMHHVLDLFDDNDFDPVISEAVRVLKPGGKLRVSLADIGKAIDKAQRGEWDWFPEPKPSAPSSSGPRFTYGVKALPIDLDKTLGFFITQGGARKQYFTAIGLKDYLDTFGVDAYVSVFGVGDLAELDSRPDESFFVEAIK